MQSNPINFDIIAENCSSDEFIKVKISKDQFFYYFYNIDYLCKDEPTYVSNIKEFLRKHNLQYKDPKNLRFQLGLLQMSLYQDHSSENIYNYQLNRSLDYQIQQVLNFSWNSRRIKNNQKDMKLECFLSENMKNNLKYDPKDMELLQDTSSFENPLLTSKSIGIVLKMFDVLENIEYILSKCFIFTFKDSYFYDCSEFKITESKKFYNCSLLTSKGKQIFCTSTKKQTPLIAKKSAILIGLKSFLGTENFLKVFPKIFNLQSKEVKERNKMINIKTHFNKKVKKDLLITSDII